MGNPIQLETDSHTGRGRPVSLLSSHQLPKYKSPFRLVPGMNLKSHWRMFQSVRPALQPLSCYTHTLTTHIYLHTITPTALFHPVLSLLLCLKLALNGFQSKIKLLKYQTFSAFLFNDLGWRSVISLSDTIYTVPSTINRKDCVFHQHLKNGMFE